MVPIVGLGSMADKSTVPAEQDIRFCEAEGSSVERSGSVYQLLLCQIRHLPRYAGSCCVSSREKPMRKG